MGFDEKYVLVGIIIGGIILSIVQIFLLKFVEEYRRYAFILPIIFFLVVIGFSLCDSGTVFTEGTVGNATAGYYSIDMNSNYQSRVFQLDWRGTLIDWFPRLFFALLPLWLPMIVIRKRGKHK